MDEEVRDLHGLQVKAKKKINALFVLACARGYLDDVRSYIRYSEQLCLSIQMNIPPPIQKAETTYIILT